MKTEFESFLNYERERATNGDVTDKTSQQVNSKVEM